MTSTTICNPIPEARRTAYAHKVFGSAFSFIVEPTIYSMASMLSPAYKGGMWLFTGLCPTGFFMFPDSDATFRVVSPNGYEGEMSAEALGITACLYAYSHLSFGDGPLADVCAEQYHLVRDYAMEHTVVREILAAID